MGIPERAKTRAKTKAAATISRAKLQARRLTTGRALAAVQWTEEAEERFIGEVKGKRDQRRGKLRLMTHNRSADEKGHHSIKRYQGSRHIWCEKCGEGRDVNVKRQTQLPLTMCRGKE